MHFLTKDTVTAVAGNKVLVDAAWKTGTGTKGILGRAKKVDLDLVTVALQGNDPKFICWFDDEDPFNNGSLVSGGDSTGRKGFGQIIRGEQPVFHEQHSIMFDAVPAYVDTLVTMLSAYKPDVSFSDVSSATMDVTVDGQPWTQLAATINSRHNTVVILKSVRQGTGWGMTEVNQLVTAQTRAAMMAQAASFA